MLKSLIRSAAARTLHGSGLLGIHRRVFQRGQALVLMYHRVLNVDEVPADLEAGMYVTTPAFAQHVAHLAEAYDVVDLDALLAWQEGRRTFAKTPCVITFDDGWQDNYTNAFPLLQQYGLTATIFLITGQIGDPEMLTWDQVHEMEAAGIRFASHTVTHPVLTELDPGQIEWELAESRRQLEGRIKNPSRWFCYPKGYYDIRTRDIASKHYAAAVTTRREPASRESNRFEIPRIGVHDDIASNTSLFALRLSGLQ
jgi:peptidoglycan/xylan/chitin deacetylase (PgdA/CDA1 family)